MMAESDASYSEELVETRDRVLLGEGAFGRVYQATMKVAIKEIKMSHHALKEVQTLQSLHHDHILKYYNHHYEDGMVSLVMEFADLGTLSEKIREEAEMADSMMFKEFAIWRFTNQISSALDYLHSQPRPILHRDLKPENILGVTNKLTGLIKWKLADFGLVKLLEEEEEFYAHTVCGTATYMAPEVAVYHSYFDIEFLFAQVWTNYRGYTFGADIWSFGCILAFRCLRGSHLFHVTQNDLRFDISSLDNTCFHSGMGWPTR